jgi:AcrR family transcriptional regulator
METAEPKWRRRADERPGEVLDAALRLFVRNGFAATKVEDIATDAGLSKGAIYRYFSSKEEIFESLVNRALTPMADRTTIIARTSQENPAVLLKNILTMVVGILADADTLALPRLVLMEAGRFPELAAAYRRQVIDKAIAALETIVRRGVDEGVFRPVNPRLAVRNIIGPVLAHIMLGQVFGIEEDADITPMIFVESHIDILINGLAKTQAGG